MIMKFIKRKLHILIMMLIIIYIGKKTVYIIINIEVIEGKENQQILPPYSMCQTKVVLILN